MKHIIKRVLALLVSLALIPGLLPLLAGCGKNAPAQEEGTKNDSILTNIYDRVSGADSEGMLLSEIRSFWNAEKGTLTYVTADIAEELVSEEDPEQGAVQYEVYSLVTLSEDGTTAKREILDDRDGYGDELRAGVWRKPGGVERDPVSYFDQLGISVFDERRYEISVNKRNKDSRRQPCGVVS